MVNCFIVLYYLRYCLTFRFSGWHYYLIGHEMVKRVQLNVDRPAFEASTVIYYVSSNKLIPSLSTNGHFNSKLTIT